MKKESISFSWDKYITGKYKVETSNGQNVIISGRNPDAEIDDDKIVGWYGDGSIASSWADDGCYLNNKNHSDYNLVLIPIEEELEPVTEGKPGVEFDPYQIPEGYSYIYVSNDGDTCHCKRFSLVEQYAKEDSSLFVGKYIGRIKTTRKIVS
jgi:hypothetical protein